MNFTDSIKNIIKRLFGADPIVTDAETSRLEQQNRVYKDLHGVNLTAIFAGKLSALTMTESTLDVIGDNVRAEMLRDALLQIWEKSRKWVSIVFGTGGAVLIPYVINGKIYTDIIPQSRMIINSVNGDELRAVSILADSTVQGERKFFRWTDYVLDDSGMLLIRQRATDGSGSPVPLFSVAEWAGIVEEMAITGVERLPFAYIKCPVDNRRSEALYGVPVTFGCDDLIDEITECLEDIRREYKLKKPIVGMDQTLFDVKNGKRNLPVTGLFMPTMPGGLNDRGKLWEVYDPAIRDSAYYNRLMNLYELLEKQVGTSRGILTEPTSRGATATEIKAGLYDTYSIVQLMRSSIEKGIDQLAYGIDVLCNFYSLAPMGEYELSYDWSYSMIESSQESFNQLISAVTVGAVDAAEVRQYVMPDETLEEAEERVLEIRQAKAETSGMLMDAVMDEESKRG